MKETDNICMHSLSSIMAYHIALYNGVAPRKLGLSEAALNESSPFYVEIGKMTELEKARTGKVRPEMEEAAVAEGVSAEKILEIKRHLNKPDESYLCDLFKQGSTYVVLKYVSEQPGRVASVTFEVGSTTYAYCRAGSGYVLWRMLGPDHVLKGHLFHICRDQVVGEDRVEYLDLLLDIWIDAYGQLSILDRDEVEECVTKGVLNEQDLAWIAKQKQEIIKNRAQIIYDFDSILAKREG